MKQIFTKLRLLFSRDDTVIEIKGHDVKALRGDVKQSLLSEIEDLLQLGGSIEEEAYILVMSEKKFFRLKFIGIPKHLHQRFRNVWGAN